MNHVVKWIDKFGQENLLIEGQGDDVFLVVPDEKDEDGNYPVRILSKKAMIEFVNQTE